MEAQEQMTTTEEKFEAAVIHAYDDWKVLRRVLIKRNDPKMPVTPWTGVRYRKSITLYGALTTARNLLKSSRQRALFVADNPDLLWSDPPSQWKPWF